MKLEPAKMTDSQLNVLAWRKTYNLSIGYIKTLLYLIAYLALLVMVASLVLLVKYGYVFVLAFLVLFVAINIKNQFLYDLKKLKKGTWKTNTGSEPMHSKVNVQFKDGSIKWSVVTGELNWSNEIDNPIVEYIRSRA